MRTVGVHDFGKKKIKNIYKCLFLITIEHVHNLKLRKMIRQFVKFFFSLLAGKCLQCFLKRDSGCSFKRLSMNFEKSIVFLFDECFAFH